MNEKNNIKSWYDSINGIFCLRGIPQRYRWKGQNDIVRVLNTIGKPELSVAYEPSGNSANFLGVRDNGGIELILEKDAEKITKRIQPIEKKVQDYILPGSLWLGSFEEDNGAFTYLCLETDKGTYAFFARESPLREHEIIPKNYKVDETCDEFRKFIGDLKKNY